MKRSQKQFRDEARDFCAAREWKVTTLFRLAYGASIKKHRRPYIEDDVRTAIARYKKSTDPQRPAKMRQGPVIPDFVHEYLAGFVVSQGDGSQLAAKGPKPPTVTRPPDRRSPRVAPVYI